MHPDKIAEIDIENLDIIVTDRAGSPQCIISYDCPVCEREHETVLE